MKKRRPGKIFSVNQNQVSGTFGQPPEVWSVKNTLYTVWEVIRNHDDYKFASTPYPGTRSMNNLELMALGQRLADQIKFDTVRQNNKRIVLCIDYSTSMNEARLPRVILSF